MVQTLQNTVEVPQFQLVGFFDLVVDISVVVQRQIPMVLFRTTEFFQLQYTDKVIDGCAARGLRRDVVWWWIFHSWWCLRFCLGQCQAVDWKIHHHLFLVPRGRGCVCMLNGWFSSNDTICADNYIFFRFKLQACVAVRSGSCICTAI